MADDEKCPCGHEDEYVLGEDVTHLAVRRPVAESKNLWTKDAARLIEVLAYEREWYTAHANRCPEVLLQIDAETLTQIRDLAGRADELGLTGK